MKIETVRFLVCGREPPVNSRFKGKVDSEALVGYMNYTGREEAKENDKGITELEGGYFGYTTSHTSATFSSMGELSSIEQKEEFKQEVAKSFSKTDNLAWDYVISLESDQEAEECGLSTASQWNAMVEKVMPKIAREYNVDVNNLHWWFDLHTNTEHPHIHLVFLEKNQTRTRGKISDKQLENTKRFFWNEIKARKELEKRVGKNYEEYFKEKDLAFNELITKIDSDVLKENKRSLNKLYKLLPKTGRLQYNSVHMKDHRELIDGIIKDVILSSDDLKEQISNYMECIDNFENAMNSVGGKVATIKEAEMKKLYERVGNMILQNYKKKEVVNVTLKIKKKHKASSTSKEEYVEKQVQRRKKFLTKKRIEREISSVAFHQQAEIEKALEDFYARFENDLI